MPYSGGGSSAAGSIVVGNPVSGGTNGTILFINSTGNLASHANAAINDSGAVTFTGGVTFNSANTNFNANQVQNIDTSIIFNSVSYGVLGALTFTTPDTVAFRTGTVSNSLHIYEQADVTFDFQNCSAGTSASTNPLLCIHSNNQSTTQWIDFKHDGTNGVIATGAGGITLSPTANRFFLNSTELRLGASEQLTWSANADPSGTSTDIGFARVVAGVVGMSIGNGGGTTGQRWLQQSAGELALNANYTNATATFSNTVLSAAVISGRTYSFTMALTFDDSTAADGAQFDFNGGSAAATNFRVQCNASNATGAALVLTNAGTTALATAVQVALALTTQAGIECNGTFTPSGNGTFIVRAAQTAHSTGTLTVHRGSWLNIRDANPL